jgi:hypothetical protein
MRCKNATEMQDESIKLQPEIHHKETSPGREDDQSLYSTQRFFQNYVYREVPPRESVPNYILP